MLEMVANAVEYADDPCMIASLIPNAEGVLLIFERLT